MTDKEDSRARLERFIGARLRRERAGQGLKVADVARIAGISQGMLSKIENNQVSPSLDTLSRLCDALGLSLSQLFTYFDETSPRVQLVRAGEGMEVVRRGTDKGHNYRLLSYRRGPQKSFEPYLITMDDASEVFPTFVHPGIEFIYLLKGRLIYRCGRELYEMGPGDSLTLDGQIPHGPEKLLEVPLQLLSIMNYGDS